MHQPEKSLELAIDDGIAVQANQHLIIHGNEGIILDPGGHKVYSKALSESYSLLGNSKLRYIFFSTRTRTSLRQ